MRATFAELWISSPFHVRELGRCAKLFSKSTNLSIISALLFAFFISTSLARAEYVFQMIREFVPTNGDPANISAPLVEGIDGNFYGTTYDGGSNNGGTIFRITRSGELTTLYSFNPYSPYGSNAISGHTPLGLVLTDDGSFYGITQYRSVNSVATGTLFRLTTNGVVDQMGILDSGWSPLASLIYGNDGDFYGVSQAGGAYGNGFVFKITTNAALTILASLHATNGSYPAGGLTLGNNGAFYGTTWFDQSYSLTGTIFKVATNGEMTTLVYFNGTNGLGPFCRLAKAADGNFYGTTVQGSASNAGTIFKMSEGGELTTIVSFPGTDGRFPQGDIFQAPDGNFYGTAASLSATNFGTLFKMTMTGELSTIFHFNGTNAVHPYAFFTLGSDGNVYGTLTDRNRQQSLDGNAGAIFRLVEAPKLVLTWGSDHSKLTWNSFTNGKYRLEKTSSPDSTNWTAISSNITAAGNSTSFTNATAGAAQEFYRVVLLP